MALTKIEYGSVASSEVVNNNFQYLDDRIESVSQALSVNVTTINNSVSLLSTTVANNKSQIEENISTLQSDVGTQLEELDARIYVIETYKSGKNWYRLYSDGWIEQGGYVALSGTNSSKTVTLLKTMNDTNYGVFVSGINATANNNWDVGTIAAVPKSASQIKITTGRDAAGGGTYWQVFGFVA